jgi:hypothetical protein
MSQRSSAKALPVKVRQDDTALPHESAGVMLPASAAQNSTQSEDARPCVSGEVSAATPPVVARRLTCLQKMAIRDPALSRTNISYKRKALAG